MSASASSAPSSSFARPTPRPPLASSPFPSYHDAVLPPSSPASPAPTYGSAAPSPLPLPSSSSLAVSNPSTLSAFSKPKRPERTAEQLAADKEKKRLKSRARKDRLRAEKEVLKEGSKVQSTVEVREVRPGSSGSSVRGVSRDPSVSRTSLALLPCPGLLRRSADYSNLFLIFLPLGSTVASSTDTPPFSEPRPALSVSIQPPTLPAASSHRVSSPSPSLIPGTVSTTTADSEPRTPPETPRPGMPPFGDAELSAVELKKLKRKEKSARKKARDYAKAVELKLQGSTSLAASSSASPPVAGISSSRTTSLKLSSGVVLVSLPKSGSETNSGRKRQEDPVRVSGGSKDGELTVDSGYREEKGRKEAIVVKLPTARISRRPSPPLLSTDFPSSTSTASIGSAPPTRRHSPSPLRIVSPKPAHPLVRPVPLLGARASSESDLVFKVQPSLQPQPPTFDAVDSLPMPAQQQLPLDLSSGPAQLSAPFLADEAVIDAHMSYQSEYPSRPPPPPPLDVRQMMANANVVLPPGYVVDGGIYYDPRTGQPFIYAYPTMANDGQPPPPPGMFKQPSLASAPPPMHSPYGRPPPHHLQQQQHHMPLFQSNAVPRHFDEYHPTINPYAPPPTHYDNPYSMSPPPMDLSPYPSVNVGQPPHPHQQPFYPPPPPQRMSTLVTPPPAPNSALSTGGPLAPLSQPPMDFIPRPRGSHAVRIENPKVVDPSDQGPYGGGDAQGRMMVRSVSFDSDRTAVGFEVEQY